MTQFKNQMMPRTYFDGLAGAWLNRRARPEAHAVSAVADLRAAAVVTGGSRGIGLALAKQFAAAGYDVLLVARSPVNLEEAVDAVSKAANVRVVPLAIDLRSDDALGKIRSALAGAGLYADVAVNNAGIGLGGPFVSHDAEAIQGLLDLNIKVVTHITRSFLPEMLARGRGGVLNIASLGGLVPGPNQAAYYASKAYVVSLTEAVASEIAGRGVRVSVAVPGPVDTAFHAEMGADRALYRWLIPASSPESVARSAYRGWRLGRRLIGPGVTATIGTYALRVLPHTVTVPLIKRLLERPEDRSGTG